MKKFLIISFCGIVFLFSACNFGPKMSVHFKAKQADFDVKTAYLDVYRDNRLLRIGNYDFKMKEEAVSINSGIRSEDQFRLEIFLADLEKGANENIEPSEYTDDLNSSGNTKTIADVRLFYFGDGEEKNENLKDYTDGKKRGSVKFTKVTDNSVTGEVDIKDDEGRSVKGTFVAKIFRK